MKYNTTNTPLKRIIFNPWIKGAIVVLFLSALAGWHGRTNAQETGYRCSQSTGDIVIIGDDIDTSVEILCNITDKITNNRCAIDSLLIKYQERKGKLQKLLGELQDYKS